MVIDRQLYPLQQFDNWWNEETDYSPFYMAVASSTVRMLAEKFNDNFEQIKEDYNADAYGLQSWLECEVEPKLFWLKHASGIQTPFAVGNWEKQEERNVLWEENVRPNFNPPLDGYGWRGLGGDEDSKLFEKDHEYRDVSRQVSWVTFEGDTTDILEDEYIRWWIL
jgi:hypothetical protein